MSKRIYVNATAEVDTEVDVTEEVQEEVARRIEEMNKPHASLNTEYATARIVNRKVKTPAEMMLLLASVIGDDVLSREVKRWMSGGK